MHTVAFYDKTVEDPRSIFELFHPEGLGMFDNWRRLFYHYIRHAETWKEEEASLDLSPLIEPFAMAQWSTNLIVPERIDIIVCTPPSACHGLPQH